MCIWIYRVHASLPYSLEGILESLKDVRFYIKHFDGPVGVIKPNKFLVANLSEIL